MRRRAAAVFYKIIYTVTTAQKRSVWEMKEKEKEREMLQSASAPVCFASYIFSSLLCDALHKSKPSKKTWEYTDIELTQNCVHLTDFVFNIIRSAWAL